MRVGVLTFHASINYGSYWQARCLVEGLRARGHDAVLLDHRSCSVRSRELRSAFQPSLPERTPRREQPALGRKVRAFDAAVSALPLSAAFALDDPAAAGDYDAVVVGSDEVWNFAHPWYGFRPIFFGDGLRGRLVSYAASFGNHEAARGIDPDWAAKLKRFDAVSVRDDNSARLVREALGAEPAMVLDPCLQFPEVLPPSQEAGDYAILYGHGLPEWFARAVRRWAHDAGVRLVSVGYPNPHAHENAADAGPLEFARLIAGARGVATSFFHGSVFALHYGKPFVAAASPYRRIKLEGLTAALGCTERLIDEESGDNAIAALMATPANVARPLAEKRQRSAAFLEQALG